MHEAVAPERMQGGIYTLTFYSQQMTRSNIKICLCKISSIITALEQVIFLGQHFTFNCSKLLYKEWCLYSKGDANQDNKDIKIK